MSEFDSIFQKERFTGVVLAGGKSARFGESKPRMVFQGEPLAARAHRTLSGVFDRTIVITAEKDNLSDLGLPVVQDLLPEKGPLGGIYTALKSIETDYAFVMACDQPFVNAGLIRHICAAAVGCDALVPRTEELLYPLFACYSRNCLPFVEDYIKRDILKIIRFYPDVNTKYMEREEIERYDPGMKSFFNINRPEDFEEAKKVVENE